MNLLQKVTSTAIVLLFTLTLVSSVHAQATLSAHRISSGSTHEVIRVDITFTAYTDNYSSALLDLSNLPQIKYPKILSTNVQLVSDTIEGVLFTARKG